MMAQKSEKFTDRHTDRRDIVRLGVRQTLWAKGSVPVVLVRLSTDMCLTKYGHVSEIKFTMSDKLEITLPTLVGLFVLI